MKKITQKEIEKSLRMSSFFLNKIWPVMRVFAGHKLSKRCSRCSLNENYVVIKDSVCEICKSSNRDEQEKNDLSIKKQENKLHDLFLSLPGRRKSLYDAILLFSGGKDSIYILHKLISDYPDLRILALTIDNGFRSPVGKQNAEQICDHYNIDHMELRPYKIFNKLYKFCFTNFSHKGFITTDFFEGELFQDIGRHVAAEFNCSTVILGYTSDQINSIPEGLDNYHLYPGGECIVEKEQFFTRRQFSGLELSDIFTSEEMEYWWDYKRYNKTSIPRMVFPLAGWGYDREKIEKTVLDLGIVENIDPMLTNDLYCSIGIFLDYQISGYSSIEPEWARQVRAGKLNKNSNRNMWELVEYISLHNKKMFEKSADFSFPLARLGMNFSDLENIIRHSAGRKR